VVITRTGAASASIGTPVPVEVFTEEEALAFLAQRTSQANAAGVRTAGVKRQDLGCVGKVANGINTVHLAYAREGTGHALIGAREWIRPGKSVIR
jgi:hypothetical protein